MTAPTYHPLPATHWSLVRRAGVSDTAARREALEILLNRYLPALRSYLCSVRRMPLDKADEILQAFVADKILDQQLFAHANEARGRFRTFLLTSLQRYQISRHRSDSLRKMEPLPAIDPPEPEPLPSQVFDVAWARALLDTVLTGMQAECMRLGRADVWAIFEARVVAETLRDQPAEPYEVLATRLKLASPAQAANLLVTAKRMYARLLHEAIAEYEPDETKIAAELESLRAILAAGRAAPRTKDEPHDT